MTDDLRLEAARKRVDDLRHFYTHLLIYVLVNFGLFVIDAVQGGGWWFYWTTLGWGIGVLAHGMVTMFSGRRMSAWEQRKVDRYLEETPAGRDRISHSRG